MPPKPLPKRKNPRLKDYDYSQAGGYFITIVTHKHKLLFGDVVRGEMRQNQIGKIVQSSWHEIPAHFPNVILDEFIVMPNHLHGILFIHEGVGSRHASTAKEASPRATHASPLLPKAGAKTISIGAIIGSFKSAATKQINEIRNTTGESIWQRGYYDRIIRNDDELDNLRHYTHYNPAKWPEDDENPGR